MRRIMLVSTIAALSFSFFSVSVSAGVMPDVSGLRMSGGVEHVTHYYGHKPKCFWKKIKKYDYYGNLVIKKVKVCH
ncbi:hypothetical protein MUO32_16850 [Shinella sp. CPCC 101442]|uniref:hypothetical protein n=1 Tax=Shinella sp. CPCC 101442 TaxID=2932265 RepID=UPI0021535E10|nr:hypothetical protein [Shinella sp. CPCC 101442]MCR6500720.1 hypothetical protein [Shinella sp. CPCC 101442]